MGQASQTTRVSQTHSVPGLRDGLRRCAQRLKNRWHRLLAEYHGNTRGATTLEWALLLAAVALPSYVIFMLLLETLVAHYRMMVMLNHLPFP